MTTRGGTQRPHLLALDPTLQSRPVPHSRTFAILSYGLAGTAPATTSCRDLDVLADHRTYAGHGSYRPVEDVRQLLQTIDASAKITYDGRTGPVPSEPDLTWGIYVFLTAYDQATLAALPTAVGNIVRVQERLGL